MQRCYGNANFNPTERFVQKQYQFTLGVRNLLDTKPPRISSFGFTTVADAPLYSGYDYVGRQIFANANIKF